MDCTKLTDLQELVILKIFKELDSDGGVWTREVPGSDVFALARSSRYLLQTLSQHRLESLGNTRFTKYKSETPMRVPSHFIALVKLAGDNLKNVLCENDVQQRDKFDDVPRALLSTRPPLEKLEFMHRIGDVRVFNSLLEVVEPSLQHLGLFLDSDQLVKCVTGHSFPSLSSLALNFAPSNGSGGRLFSSMYGGAGNDGDDKIISKSVFENFLDRFAPQLHAFSICGDQCPPRLLHALSCIGDKGENIKKLSIHIGQGVEMADVSWATDLIFSLGGSLCDLHLDGYFLLEEEDGGCDDNLPLNADLATRILNSCPKLKHVDLVNTQQNKNDNAGIIQAFGSRLRQFTVFMGMSFNLGLPLEGLSALSECCENLQDIRFDLQDPTAETFSLIRRVIRKNSSTLEALRLRRTGDLPGEWRNRASEWVQRLCDFVDECPTHEDTNHRCHSRIWVFLNLASLFTPELRLKTLDLEVALCTDDLNQILNKAGSSLQSLYVDNAIRPLSAPNYTSVKDYEGNAAEDMSQTLSVIAKHCPRLEKFWLMEPFGTNAKRGIGQCCHKKCHGECKRKLQATIKEVREDIPHVDSDYFSALFSSFWN
eukprot:Plantae.Rhodophyta-Hildenbrandia_rubra.ctg1767.p1 GENE.Plantae.Rhodophyta-Hildenbrandia_rubra.ctg1767~~Plantae.Rhodophyta-Hildenbrandia_rubra.ctg1767.p1  ORF type:complete len:596 (+),score=63.51 Plantae.Rhodophyta-Hildenbrandia_rubra.ctg1767:112-1899(+)